jgi:hypothetical protein
VSQNVHRKIYDDIVIRLVAQDNVVVVISPNLAYAQSLSSVSSHITSQLMLECVINYKIKLVITELIFIGHMMSCDTVINLMSPGKQNKLILIDPVLSAKVPIIENKTNNMSINNEITVITFSDKRYDQVLKNKIEKLTPNVFTLNVDSSNIFGLTNISSNRSCQINKLTTSIKEMTLNAKIAQVYCITMMLEN